MCLNSGVQKYLNKVFVSDRTVSAYSNRLQLTKAACHEDDEGLTTMRADCIRKNLTIVSGDVGVELLDDYIAYVDFEASAWDN